MPPRSRQESAVEHAKAAAAGPQAAPGGPVALPDPATVVVVGGGPAGSFFAIRLLRRARELGRAVNVIILEKKTEICFYRPVPFCSWEGCNYCAGGVSPRLIDVLRAERHRRARRGDREQAHRDHRARRLEEHPVAACPKSGRCCRCSAARGPGSGPDGTRTSTPSCSTWRPTKGAEVITAEVERRPLLGRRQACASATGRSSTTGSDLPDETVEADFAVFAGGVNRSPGHGPARPTLCSRRSSAMIPGLRPPKVRKAVIAEMLAGEDVLRSLDGEVHFMQYGSKDLHIEMASLMPKKEWITAVLMGKSIDRADPSEYLAAGAALRRSCRTSGACFHPRRS